MNPYILQIAREKIKRGGEIVLQEFEDGFAQARWTRHGHGAKIKTR